MAVRARGEVQYRRPSQICRLERVVGYGIIAPRRRSSAHLHRPWRAISATAKVSLACAASIRILAAMPRRCGSQPKISKTTPCKVAGGRRQDALGQYLTPRANQRHSFIIAQSVKRPWARNGAPFGVILGENPYPRLKLHWLVKLQWLAAASDRLRVAEPPRFRRACRRSPLTMSSRVTPWRR
jgi:hypothetical protein